MSVHNQPGYTFKETKDAIQFSIRNEKQRLQLLLVIVNLLGFIIVFLLMVLKLIALINIGITQDAALKTLALFTVSVLVLWGFYLGFRQSLNNAFVQEDIRITGDSISIKRSGFLGFRFKKVILSEKVKGLSLLIQFSVENNRLADWMFNTTQIGKLMISPRNRIAAITYICRGISLEEVIRILDKIQVKFPHYS